MRILGVQILLYVFGFSLAWANEDYRPYFTEAYQTYPGIPEGLLEAIAYTNTRAQHIVPGTSSCAGLPAYYGVMGLIEDGQGFFAENLLYIAQLSGYSTQEIKQNPRINILAYAAAYNKLRSNKRLRSLQVEDHREIISALSELPQADDELGRLAVDQQYYAILREMETPHIEINKRIYRSFDYEQIFGRDQFEKLSAPGLRVERPSLTPSSALAGKCGLVSKGVDFSSARFVAAHKNNFSQEKRFTPKYIAIHTIQGSYASAIAWFRNPYARVSAHYVIRASDGQITQMVCEQNMAFHVREENESSIGIEHEGFVDEGYLWYSEQMYNSSAVLVQDIAKRQGISVQRAFAGAASHGLRPLSHNCYKIKGHQHFPNNQHLDPGKYWDWGRYYRLLNGDPEVKVYTRAKGTIYDSGGKRGNYKDLEYEGHLIDPNTPGRLALDLKKLDLEGTPKAPFDFLTVYDGDNSSGRFLGSFSGKNSPPTLWANSGKAYLEFHADCQVNRPGWQLDYRQVEPSSCAPPKNLKANSVFSMGAVLSWDAVPSAERYLLYLRHQQLDKKWTLYRTRSNTLTVTGLAANGIHEWQLQAICGADTSAPVGSTFSTTNISRKGAPQTYTLRLNRGRLFDSGGMSGSYQANEAYLYRIEAPNGQPIELRFSQFETEKNLDVLSIYDGPSTSAPILGQFSGDRRPPVLVARSGFITLKYTSSERVQMSGWAASWKTLPAVAETPNPTPPPVKDPVPPEKETPTHSIPESILSSSFDPRLSYPSSSPESRVALETRYPSLPTEFVFEDQDNSGRGLANRFYTLASLGRWGFRGFTNQGFAYEDFDQGLPSFWKSRAGDWQVVSGRLYQTDESNSNTNLYLPLRQEGDQVYVYHFRARMDGSKRNKRLGLHFFASEGAKSNRGNSYFFIVRDATSGDYVEIYKTINNQFSRKVRRSTQISSGKVYDFKVIYNPQKGRMEVYLNNRFTVSWVDPNPLRKGEAISFRTGGCMGSFDELRVYQKRGSKVENPLTTAVRSVESPQLKVASLVVDRNIRWSRVSAAQAQLGQADASNPSGDPPVKPELPGSNAPNGHILAPSYQDDFLLTLPQKDAFYLVANFDGGIWTANAQLGLLVDDFAGGRTNKPWRLNAGDWGVDDGSVIQTDDREPNANLSIALTQHAQSSYLYHFQAKLRREGDNQRFGLHFFSDNGSASNRGNSYMIWFRNHKEKRDQVEVYRSDNDQLELRDASFIQMDPGRWYDCKIVYHPHLGRIDAYLNDQKVISWNDPALPHQQGNAISFRTGGTEVAFRSLKVYQQIPRSGVRIKIGSAPTDHIQFKSERGQPALRLYSIFLNDLGLWSPIHVEEALIR